MVQLEKGIRDSKGTAHHTNYVFGRVVKNGYIGTAFSKPYLVNCTYNGIVKELLEPYFTEEDSVESRATKWDAMVEEAGKAIKRKPLLTSTKEGATVRKDVTPGF